MVMTIKNMLGLVCGPMEDLFEIHFVKRNAIGSTNAIVAAVRAFVGTTSSTP